MSSNTPIENNVYIGAKYITTVDGEWDSNKYYQPLTLVSNNGNYYISRVPVPAGTELTNTIYWMLFFNGEEIQGELPEIQDQLTQNTTNIAQLNTAITNIDSQIAELVETVKNNLEVIFIHPQNADNIIDYNTLMIVNPISSVTWNGAANVSLMAAFLVNHTTETIIPYNQWETYNLTEITSGDIISLSWNQINNGLGIRYSVPYASSISQNGVSILNFALKSKDIPPKSFIVFRNFGAHRNFISFLASQPTCSDNYIGSVPSGNAITITYFIRSTEELTTGNSGISVGVVNANGNIMANSTRYGVLSTTSQINDIFEYEGSVTLDGTAFTNFQSNPRLLVSVTATSGGSISHLFSNQ